MAYCRSCDNEVKDNAIACTKCGLRPSDGNKYCQDCGKETNEKAVMCVACGVSLINSSNSGISIGGSNANVSLGPNDNPTDFGTTILWFLCCMPIGFSQWGQTTKGWAWVGICMISGGLAGIVMWADYWMCYSAQQKRKLGEWEFFPSS